MWKTVQVWKLYNLYLYKLNLKMKKNYISALTILLCLHLIAQLDFKYIYVDSNDNLIYRFTITPNDYN